MKVYSVPARSRGCDKCGRVEELFSFHENPAYGSYSLCAACFMKRLETEGYNIFPSNLALFPTGVQYKILEDIDKLRLTSAPVSGRRSWPLVGCYVGWIQCPWQEIEHPGPGFCP